VAFNAEKSIVTPTLPWFQSAQLVEQIGNAAADSGLTLDEVGYVLEEGANRPYLRYRVSLTIAASYPAIRRFASNVTTSLPHVDLDSINCKRSDIQVTPLTCDLAFSAFFRKDGHG
jgi:Tfp pilus assembly protein PilO